MRLFIQCLRGSFAALEWKEKNRDIDVLSILCFVDWLFLYFLFDLLVRSAPNFLLIGLLWYVWITQLQFGKQSLTGSRHSHMPQMVIS